MKSGILYKRGGRKKGEVDISAIVRKLKAIAWSLRWVGTIFIGMAALGLGVIFEPLISAEIRYAIHPPQVSQDRPSKFGFLVEDWPNWEVPNRGYSVYIPKIDAKAEVIADVDAADEKAYLAALKQGVAAARGLSTPGSKGTTYMFAHSTNSPLNFARYNAVFYLLDKVTVGDRVEVVYQDKLYRYTTVAKEILAADDVRYLTPQDNEEVLVLQTCYPPGTTWKRLVVVAKRL